VTVVKAAPIDKTTADGRDLITQVAQRDNHQAIGIKRGETAVAMSVKPTTIARTPTPTPTLTPSVAVASLSKANAKDFVLPSTLSA